jgi:hypothetical protein
MEIVVHRVNTRAGLAQVPREFGVEIDLRAGDREIVLHHEPFAGGEPFDRWLDGYAHGTLVLNIKEAGIEDEVLRRVRERGIRSYFLLDVESPYLSRATRRGERHLAVRYSEDEPIEIADRHRGRADWAWIDTITTLPLSSDVVSRLQGFKTCLVCPERWGRPQDIEPYQAAMRALGFTPTAVMTSLALAPRWSGAWWTHAAGGDR